MTPTKEQKEKALAALRRLKNNKRGADRLTYDTRDADYECIRALLSAQDEGVTETHKAAVEALEPCREAFENHTKTMHGYDEQTLRRKPTGAYFCNFVNAGWIGWQAAWNTRTLKHPSSVEVTVEELNEEICSKMHELIFQDGINADIYSILKKYEGRITRAAATDGVGNGET